MAQLNVDLERIFPLFSNIARCERQPELVPGSADYLFGSKAILPYKWVFLVFIVLGAISEIEAVWLFGDAALGFMTFPNLISIVLLAGTLKRMTNEYFSVKYPTYKETLTQKAQGARYKV